MEPYHRKTADISGGVDRFFKRAFSAIDVRGPELDIKDIARRPLMVVCTHRSHVDYFLAGWVLYFRGVTQMRFAAGSNLTRLPFVGPRFTGLGAFTVERETAFKRSYVKNLCDQVVTMMENRDTVVLFPEGGRSYSGSMLEIKSGILGAAVLLQARRPQENVYIMPMAISYEQPPDAPWFGILLAGKRLRRRTNGFLSRLVGSVLYFGADILAFAPFVAAPKTGRRYGSVYIDYDAPRPVRTLIDVTAAASSEGHDEFFRFRASMQELGRAMGGRLSSLFRILPLHVLAALVSRQGALTSQQAAALVPQLLERLGREDRNCTALERCSPAEIIEQGKQQLLRLGAIAVRNGGLVCRRRLLLDYCAAAAADAV